MAASGAVLREARHGDSDPDQQLEWRGDFQTAARCAPGADALPVRVGALHAIYRAAAAAKTEGAQARNAECCAARKICGQVWSFGAGSADSDAGRWTAVCAGK